MEEHSSILVTPTWPCHAWHEAHPLSVCLAAAAQRTQLGTSLADYIAWQTYLPDATAHDTSLYPSAVPKQYWRELRIEAFRDSDYLPENVCVYTNLPSFDFLGLKA
jgi:hypothetical protein